MNIGTRLVKMGVATAVTAALFGGMAFGSAASAAAMTQVQSNVPLLMDRAVFTGHHNPKAVLNVTVALSLQNSAKLAAYMQQLQDRSSPNYHKFLTPKQFIALYCPSAAQVKAVEQFLTQRGITVKSVSPNNMRIHASATTAAYESAFGVAVNDYKRADGTAFYSASTDPSVPSTISGYVKAVMGLDNAAQYQPHLVMKEAAAKAALSGPTPGGFSPQQIATAYNWPLGTHHKAILTDTTLASGVTIAIATAYTYRPGDIQKFWSTYGLPSHTLTNVSIDGLTTRLEGETTLDIERSSSMSPGSNIVVFEAADPGTTAFDDEFEAIADDTTHPISVMSTSWGLAENESAPASIAAEHDSFTQLTVEGVILMAAAGDGGAADRETPGTDNGDFPSSDPFVLAAGGTNLVLNGDNTISAETAWTDAGGADSMYFAQPAFETGAANWQPNSSCSGDFTAAFTPAPLSSTAPAALATEGCASAGAASRQSSDMAMDADPATGYSVYFNGQWGQAGGTSFVAPEFAGLFAILVKANGGLVGAGPALVFCNAAHTESADFNDIVLGANSPLGGTFDASNGTGWDHPTGWGTPKASTFLTDAIANCIAR